MMEACEVNGNMYVLTLDDYHCANMSSGVMRPLAHSQSRAQDDCQTTSEKVM